ncbi:hypothetical protein BDE02_16G010600 [Populus trichocarpa]|nr:hypothetical protein BDE02_16G010600 [Populus trichocarpa]
MAKLWLVDTASSPLILLLLSFAFSLGSGNAEGSSNGLGDFPLLVFFFCLCVSWVSQSSALSPVSSPCFVTCLSVFVSVLAGRQTKTMIHEETQLLASNQSCLYRTVIFPDEIVGERRGPRSDLLQIISSPAESGAPLLKRDGEDARLLATVPFR